MLLPYGLKAAANFCKGLPIEYVGGRSESFVGADTDITVSLTGLTGGFASQPQAGDLVIIFFAISATTLNVISATGYVDIGRVFADNTADTVLYAGYKIMGSTPDTTATLPGGTFNVDNAGAVVVQVWKNVDPICPLASFTWNGSSSAALPDPNATTPAVQCSVIVAAGASAYAVTTPQTFASSDLTDFRSAAGSDTRDVTIGAGYYQGFLGTYKPAAFTWTTDPAAPDYSSASITLSLRPAQSYTGVVPTLVSSTNQQFASGTSITLTKPTGVQAGDVLVALIGSGTGSSGNVTLPIGWTLGVSDLGNAFLFRASIYIAYKVATSSEPASYTFTFTNALAFSTILSAFRDAVLEQVGAVNTLTFPQVLLAYDYSLVLFNASSGISSTPPTVTGSTNFLIQEADGNNPSSSLGGIYRPAGLSSVNARPTGTGKFVIVSLRPA